MNKKGFVVSAVLYPLLILFLALMMGLLAMSSTRKNILDNMKMEISDSIFDSVTCDCEIINKTLKQYGDDITSIETAINELKNKVTNIENNYAKKTDLSDYLKKGDLNLSDYVTEEIVKKMIQKSENSIIATLNEQYVTHKDLIASLNGYATTETTTILNNKVTDLTNRVNRIEATLNPTIRLKVGDYVYMKPYSTSYTIPYSDTGYGEDVIMPEGSSRNDLDQTINPSELTLWRVIRDNGGTYDMVSEYTSSTKVYFYGQTGYNKLVGTLQKIAAQYKGPYIVSARMMGYDGQSLDGTNYFTLTKANCGSSTSSRTSDNSKELSGCGDVSYRTDIDLVGETYALDGLTGNKRLIAYAVNDPSTATSYWMASREYFYSSSSLYTWNGRIIEATGYNENSFGLYFVGDWAVGYIPHIRPIVTLGSQYYISSGSGTKTNPYVLS